MNHPITQESATGSSERMDGKDNQPEAWPDEDLALGLAKGYLVRGNLKGAQVILESHLAQWEPETRQKKLVGLWAVATEKALGDETRAWLEGLAPLAVGIQHLPTSETWFHRLQTYNPDVMDHLSRNLSQGSPAHLGLNALMASIGVGKQPGQQPQWDRWAGLAGIAKGELPGSNLGMIHGATTMRRILARALDRENPEAIHWALNYLPYLRAEEILIGGLQDMGRGRLDAGKLQRLLLMAQPIEVEWDELWHRLGEREMVEKVKAAMERARLEKEIKRVGGARPPGSGQAGPGRRL